MINWTPTTSKLFILSSFYRKGYCDTMGFDCPTANCVSPKIMLLNMLFLISHTYTRVPLTVHFNVICIGNGGGAGRWLTVWFSLISKFRIHCSLFFCCHLSGSILVVIEVQIFWAVSLYMLVRLSVQLYGPTSMC